MSDASAAIVPQLSPDHFISVHFSVSGSKLPADHGYLVYSAISRTVDIGIKATGTAMTGTAGVSHAVSPDHKRTVSVPPIRSPLHKADWLAIELISGFSSGRGLDHFT